MQVVGILLGFAGVFLIMCVGECPGCSPTCTETPAGCVLTDTVALRSGPAVVQLPVPMSLPRVSSTRLPGFAPYLC